MRGVIRALERPHTQERSNARAGGRSGPSSRATRSPASGRR